MRKKGVRHVKTVVELRILIFVMCSHVVTNLYYTKRSVDSCIPMILQGRLGATTVANQGQFWYCIFCKDFFTLSIFFFIESPREMMFSLRVFLKKEHKSNLIYYKYETFFLSSNTFLHSSLIYFSLVLTLKITVASLHYPLLLIALCPTIR